MKSVIRVEYDKLYLTLCVKIVLVSFVSSIVLSSPSLLDYSEVSRFVRQTPQLSLPFILSCRDPTGFPLLNTTTSTPHLPEEVFGEPANVSAHNDSSDIAMAMSGTNQNKDIISSAFCRFRSGKRNLSDTPQLIKEIS